MLHFNLMVLSENFLKLESYGVVDNPFEYKINIKTNKIPDIKASTTF